MAFKASPSSQIQHCTDEAQKAEAVLSAVIYIFIYIKYIYGGGKQINYRLITTRLFRGRSLIRGFNENKLYHRLYTIQFV